MPELHHISSTPDSGPLLLWWQWLLLTLALYALTRIVLRILRRKRVRINHECDPLALALSQLNELEGAELPRNDFATQLSLITRHYLQQAFGDPALFETAEEFHSRSAQLQRIPQPASEQLRSYLSHISQQQYAPSTGSCDQANLIQHTSQLLQDLSQQTLTPSCQP